MFKKLIITALLLFSFTSNVNATQSSINPQLPSSSADLSSLVVRNNFLAAYNDINNLYSLVGSIGSGVTWPSSGYLIISNASNTPSGLAPVNGSCAQAVGGVWVAAPCSPIATQVTVSTGATNTVSTVGVSINWNSATASAKTQTIPASTGSRGIIVISDFYGSAATYHITAVPVTGSITGVNQVYTNNGSITLLDTTNGWMSI